MNNNQGLHAHVHIVREKMTHDKNVLEEHLWIEFGEGDLIDKTSVDK